MSKQPSSQAWAGIKMKRIKKGQKRAQDINYASTFVTLAVILTFFGAFAINDVYIPRRIANVAELLIPIVISLIVWGIVEIYKLITKNTLSRADILKDYVFPSVLVSMHLFLWLYICLYFMDHNRKDMAPLQLASILSFNLTAILTVLASDVQSICLFGPKVSIKSPLIAGVCMYLYLCLMSCAVLGFKFWMNNFVVTKKFGLQVPFTWKTFGLKDPFIFESDTLPGAASFVARSE